MSRSLDILYDPGPIVGAERRGRKTRAVEQGRFGVRLPSVAYFFRVRDRAAWHGNGAAVREGRWPNTTCGRARHERVYRALSRGVNEFGFTPIRISMR